MLPLPDVSKTVTAAATKKEPAAIVAKPIDVVKPVEASAPVAPAATAATADDGKLVNTFAYEKNKVDLSDADKSNLSAVADKVNKSQGSVHITAYAGGSAEEVSTANRTSYARALQIRAYLISKGVNQLNIGVRAKGNKVPSGNPERADIFIKE